MTTEFERVKDACRLRLPIPIESRALPPYGRQLTLLRIPDLADEAAPTVTLAILPPALKLFPNPTDALQHAIERACDDVVGNCQARYLRPYFEVDLRHVIDCEARISSVRTDDLLNASMMRTIRLLNQSPDVNDTMGDADLRHWLPRIIHYEALTLRRGERRFASRHVTLAQSIDLTNAENDAEDDDDEFLEDSRQRLQAKWPSLSPREIRFLKMKLQEKNTEEIAAELNIAPRSVPVIWFRLKQRLRAE